MYSAILVLTYALITLAGGAFAAYKVQSFVSLISAASVSSVLFVAFALMVRKKRSGLYLSLATLFFSSCFFIYRFYSTAKFFPAGFMLLLSISLIAALLFNKEAKKALDT
ncbi:MAG: hypothetical protein GWP59_02475 [Chlamydiales bacterium]|nr:hypothetical protein [Chlamydiales bacterium]NCF70547.1 hypothetical protein [Chlamydiales bacterium]